MKSVYVAPTMICLLMKGNSLGYNSGHVIVNMLHGMQFYTYFFTYVWQQING